MIIVLIVFIMLVVFYIISNNKLKEAKKQHDYFLRTQKNFSEYNKFVEEFEKEI
jgi:hypothetical protein